MHWTIKGPVKQDTTLIGTLQPSSQASWHQTLEQILPTGYLCGVSFVCKQPVPRGFSLAQTICSYGYFFLAPNTWVPAPAGQPEDQGIFCRPLICSPAPARHRKRKHGRTSRYFATEHESHTSKLTETASVLAFVILRQPEGEPFLEVDIRSQEALDQQGRDSALAAVYRILRIDQSLEPWFESHAQAAARGFGRTYRSPSLFEDMVKTITNCNIKFGRTMLMNQLLVKHFGQAGLAFPSPGDLCNVSEAHLRETAKVGYRAKRIILLAQMFASGEVGNIETVVMFHSGTLQLKMFVYCKQLQESWFEDPWTPTEHVQAKLMGLHGFGKFATSNVRMLVTALICNPSSMKPISSTGTLLLADVYCPVSAGAPASRTV